MASQRFQFLVTTVFFGALIGACGATPRAPAAPPKALLRIDCPLPDAEIWLDGRYIYEVSEVKGGIRLRPGVHRLELRHADYHSMYYEIEVHEGEQRKLEVRLAKRLR